MNYSILNHTVTVIIPVLNAAFLLQKVLEALSAQSYPKQMTQIIVVDNGSSDNSAGIAESFGAKVLFETEKRTPYAARNLGFQHATGSVIALTDANKIPDKMWLEEGVRSITENNADLAGGEILFDLDENPSSAEIYDAITYNDNRRFVFEQKSSAAGNLFFRREVLDQTGSFPDHFRSGMDMWWTQQAVQNGFKLVFSEKAIVCCKPRKLNAVLKKSYRVGVLHPVTFRQKGGSFFYILGQTFRTFAPPGFNQIKQKMNNLGQQAPLFSVWAVAWMCKMMMGLGRTRGLVYLKRNIQSNKE